MKHFFTCYGAVSGSCSELHDSFDDSISHQEKIGRNLAFGEYTDLAAISTQGWTAPDWVRLCKDGKIPGYGRWKTAYYTAVAECKDLRENPERHLPPRPVHNYAS